MIISHKYRYIFIKTRKVAGTSVEAYLNKYVGPDDVFTPISEWHKGHVPQNYKGRFNVIKELHETKFRMLRRTIFDYLNKRKFWNHMPGILIKNRIEPEIWDTYYKFTIERNPWDKIVSHYYWLKNRYNEKYSFKDYFKKGNYPTDFNKYTDLEGNIIVDKVILYEALDKELDNLFSELEIPFEGSLGLFLKSNFRENKNYKNLFDEENKKIVAKVFSNEIKLFNYIY